MLEDLMLLEGGRLAYFGTTANARTFFDSVAEPCPLTANPAGAVRCDAVRRGLARSNTTFVGAVVSVSQSISQSVTVPLMMWCSCVCVRVGTSDGLGGVCVRVCVGIRDGAQNYNYYARSHC